MKDLTFRKGAPLEKALKKNTWVMHFRNMHGDADHYEEEILEIQETDAPISDFYKILHNIIIYATRWFMNETDKYEDVKILAAADVKGIELGMNPGDGHDLYMDITGPDITSEGQYQAIPDECWITYFDIIGIEHAVEIVKDGKIFYIINDCNINEVLNEQI